MTPRFAVQVATLVALMTVIPFTPALAGDGLNALIREVPESQRRTDPENGYLRDLLASLLNPVDPVFGERVVWERSRDAVPRYEQFTCRAIRREVSRRMLDRMQLWEDLGLMRGPGCRELGEEDPDRDLTRWEKLAKKYNRGIYQPYPLSRTQALFPGTPLAGV